MGLHSTDELIADLDAVTISPAPATTLRRSTRTTKGKAPVRLEDDFHSQLFHKCSSNISTSSILSRTPSMLLHCFAAALFTQNSDLEEAPNTHSEALASPNVKKWVEAEQKELFQLKRLTVARLVTLPPGARLLPSKWVYKVKRTGLFKARFVV